MDMFRGCINSTLEELIKNYNVMYLLKIICTYEKNIYCRTVPQYFQQKRDKNRLKKKGRRTEKNNKVNVPYTLSLFFFFLLLVPFSICAICIKSFLY